MSEMKCTVCEYDWGACVGPVAIKNLNYLEGSPHVCERCEQAALLWAARQADHERSKLAAGGNYGSDN